MMKCKQCSPFAFPSKSIVQILKVKTNLSLHILCDNLSLQILKQIKIMEKVNSNHNTTTINLLFVYSTLSFLSLLCIERGILGTRGVHVSLYCIGSSLQN
jgi:hypothetical protein